MPTTERQPNQTQTNNREVLKGWRKLIAVGALAPLALAGCASDTEAKPVPETPTATAPATESPAPTESESPVEPETPASPEVEPSNLTVNYEDFTNWQDKGPTGVDNLEYRREGTKLYACEQFFTANGLPGLEEANPNRDWRGEEYMNFYVPRVQMAWDLNLDTTDERNGEVALNILECLTTPSGAGYNDAYNYLSNTFQTYRGSSIEGTAPFTMDHITREGANTWFNTDIGNSAFVVEYQTQDGLGDTIYPQVTFALTKAGDVRAATIHDQDETIVWGSAAPNVIDSSRADAPYATTNG